MRYEREITSLFHGKRIDQIPIEGYSRSYLASQARFFLNGQERMGKTKVQEGQLWTIEVNTTPDLSHIPAWDHPLTIIQESTSWAAIDKPYGISVHPSNSEPSNKTIVNALVHTYGNNLAQNEETIDDTPISKPGLVHRLDKTTSGVLLIAKTNQTHQELQKKWSQTTKIYTALVQGQTPKKGRIEGGIKRDPQSKIKMIVTNDEQSKPALTTFETIEQNENVSRLKIQIHTGRTHQIRAHLSSIGFPIVGDELYGGPIADRIMLHATEITFQDPDTKKNITVQSKVPF